MKPVQQRQLKDRFAPLRARLDPEDQSLLTLRIDRGPSWEEVAMVMMPAGASTDQGEVANAAARFRQRLVRLKAGLRKLTPACTAESSCTSY